MKKQPKLIRITTVPMSLRYLITGQMKKASSEGFDVIMASADGDHLDHALENEQVAHVVLPFERDISLLKDLKSLIETIRFFKKEKPDIVHTHTPKAGLIGMLASWITRVPIRIHTVAGLPLVSLSGLKKQIVILTEKLTYRSANYVWPNSHSLLKYIRESKFTTDDKLSVIGQGSSNGIDLSEYDLDTFENKTMAAVKSQIGFLPHHKYMVFIGRLVSQKGIVELVDAFRRLETTHPEWCLILVGPFENDRDPIPQTTKAHITQSKKIISTGYSDKAKYFLKIADLCVFPSHREGFPNVPLQAGAVNCPIVASEIMGNVDVIIDKETGLLHKPKDTNDLYQKLEYAITHPEEMEKMAQNNYKRISSKFDRTYVQNEIIKKYKELLRTHQV